MRYYVTIGDRTFEVDLSGETISVDGRPVAAELESVPGTRLRHLLVDGRSYALFADRGDARGSWGVHLDGARHAIDVVDERTRAIRAMTGGGKTAYGPKPVRAPMPGLVVRIEVQAGQSVIPGQGVVIIEAMKMENELKAEAEGVVSRVLVQQGQAVEKGAVLVEFEG